MRIGPDVEPVSAISTANADTIVVRGFDLCADLLGKIGFTEHVWLLITGSLPNPPQKAILDASLVAIAEHGLVPSVQTGRMTLAAAPEALQGAVAAGILGCGSVVLGSSEAAGMFFQTMISREGDRPEGIDAAIRQEVQEYRESKRAIPGYGHPLHKGRDPRATRLLDYAGELGISGVHINVARRVEELLPELIRKPLKMNISAAIPAVLLDAGFPLRALKGVPLIARTASLVAHLLEEQLKPIGFEMSYAAGKAIRYNGATPPGFVPSEE
jgi:citrate synthase